jgi:hypothetical protein
VLIAFIFAHSPFEVRLSSRILNAPFFVRQKKKEEKRIEKNEHVVRLAALAAGAVLRVLLVAEQQ